MCLFSGCSDITARSHKMSSLATEVFLSNHRLLRKDAPPPPESYSPLIQISRLKTQKSCSSLMVSNKYLKVFLCLQVFRRTTSLKILC